MRRVIRIEDSEGCGPYHHKGGNGSIMRRTERRLGGELCLHYAHSTPTLNEEGLTYTMGWRQLRDWCDYHSYDDPHPIRFCFASVEQARGWIRRREALELIVDEGGIIREFEVDDRLLVVSPCQAVFVRPEARSVCELAVDDVFPPGWTPPPSSESGEEIIGRIAWV